MDLQHGFEIYTKQRRELGEQGRWGNPNVLRLFRQEFAKLSEATMEELKLWLHDPEKRWFVARLLDCLDSFPEALLVPMLEAAIAERDPSDNRVFIDPYRRVFDYVKIREILMDRFVHGDKAVKEGFLRALYWARPVIYSMMVYEGKRT